MATGCHEAQVASSSTVGRGEEMRHDEAESAIQFSPVQFGRDKKRFRDSMPREPQWRCEAYSFWSALGNGINQPRPTKFL
ncbi:unnamed protein product [Protopolystoma xenopodis]|uniref:Uncharacterized protein n=1 Tax=Protopolystoma xenopodis TaxID=117903 RepID=A0A3S5BQ34_9PLAT|nr:unnamed protein product [Protopolystoma xenopodis]